MTAHPDPIASRVSGVDALEVVLADGRPWGFARPSARFAPAFGAATGTETRRRRGQPPEIERLVRALRAAAVGGPPGDPHAAFLALAVALLRRAHDIGEAEAARLLDVPPARAAAVAARVLAAATETTEVP